jgi:hypothetical protein
LRICNVCQGFLCDQWSQWFNGSTFDEALQPT